MTKRSHRRPSWRGWLWLAIGVALAAHAIVLLVLRVPSGPSPEPRGPMAIVPRPVAVERPAERRPTAAPEPAEPGAVEATPIPLIRESPAAAEEATIPTTALTELRAATLPLVPTESGIGRRRIERSPEQLAVARAESLLAARLAGIAVVERRDVGTVGLANGGITLAIPWAGFLPANRRDGAWRSERCDGGDGGDGDKAGEAEARRAGC